MIGKLKGEDIDFIDFLDDNETMRIYYKDGCVTDLKYQDF